MTPRWEDDLDRDTESEELNFDGDSPLGDPSMFGTDDDMDGDFDEDDVDALTEKDSLDDKDDDAKPVDDAAGDSADDEEASDDDDEEDLDDEK